MKYLAIYMIFFSTLTFTNLIAQTTLEREWVRSYTDDFFQEARDIAVDDSGNIFVGITSFDTVSSYGFTLIKYDNEGLLRWIQKYEGPFIPDSSKSKDYVQDITVDHKNNIYVVGRSEFVQSEPNINYTTFVTIKYNSKGEQEWLAKFRIDSLGQGWYWPYIIAVDSSENVYVCGNFEKAILLKYDFNGDLLWKKSIESVSSVVSMILDNQANIYLAKPDLSILKYDSSGLLTWNSHSDTLQGIDTNYGYISLGKQNNIYVNGAHSTIYTNNKIIVTTKYDKKGNLQWVSEYGQEANYLRYVTAGCEVDVEGNVYVSGNYYNENNRDSKFIVIKYDSTGEQVWVTEFIAPVNNYMSLRKMAMDTANNIYLIGSMNSFNVSNYDYAIVKFDASGNLLYSDFYGVVERDEITTALALDNKNNVYITGDSYSNGQKVVTIKYKQKPVSIEPVVRLTPKGPELFQNYPNPFNSTTTISFTIHKTMPVNLKIYSLLGKEIKTLLNGQIQAGKHEFVLNAENLASGIYIYILKTEEFTFSRKLLLIK